ncbi:hypothetical protein [Nonomuraea sp. JJY05]|uniref:hypothetical protein n=1 Tax=Nonomuraea sp. JJY05 TaxID=3350255 RepID=UPI00373E24DD
MPNAKPAAGSNTKGLGCLAAALLFIVVGCNALFGGDTPTPRIAYTAPPIPSYPPWTPEPAPDLDDDGTADVYDSDDDGDGVDVIRDIDDRDPAKGRRPEPKKPREPRPRPEPKKAREPRPRPEPQPVQVGNVHPGGFCGTPGAVGTSRGRTYVCRGGHWRR